jgi:hypothetical protein
MKQVVAIMALLALALMSAGIVHAASDSKDVTLTATVTASAILTLTNTTINFVNATPGGTNLINGSASTTVVASFRNTTATPATLVVTAPDLANVAGDTIPITAIKTTAASDGGGSGFFDTTPSLAWSTTGTQLGTGQAGSYTTTLSYTMDNDWTYRVGSYSSTATLTLTSI